MFTGLIKDFGTVLSIDKQGDWRLVIETQKMDLSKLEIGASIACSGVCLTAIEIGKSEKTHWFIAEVSAETLSKTTLSNWNEGDKINIEPSLKMGDELGGHFVFGHVDGLATLSSIKKEGDSHRLTIKPPASLMPYIASKGSIALDGISLTVNEINTDSFGVNIVPHTWDHTTLGQRKEGDQFNIEIDMLARYVARQAQFDIKKAA